VTDSQFIVFNEAISANQFSALLQKPNALQWTTTENESISMLDSFDGRVFAAGYTVKYAKNKLEIKGIRNSEKDFESQSTSLKPPLFAEDIKDESLKSFLAKILDVRALMIRLPLSLKIKSFNIINSERKTIARGKFVNCTSEKTVHGSAKVFCFITPLRGYSREVDKVSKSWPAYSTHNNFDAGILEIYDIDLLRSSKPRFSFNKEMSISEAFHTILEDSFNIMRKNEGGIIDDIDIEFLHDYRVSGRRMRSALSLIKNILAPETSALLINDLKHIGTVSGPLRDLDVYLLREEEYKNIVPEGWSSKELHSIFITLKARRRRALKNMISLLNSEKYSEVVSRWNAFFENFDQYVENDKPLFSTASSLILKRYKKVLKEGSVLTAHSPDEGFHKLRITCKKLRYLMEFFSSLYPMDKISLAIKKLKKLQDNLGDFNDLSVQIETLNESLSNATKKKNTILIQDISGLIAVLNFKKQQLRNEFHDLFKEFSSAENSKLFKGMFAPK